jgi:predicted nucleotidyltransferase
VTALPDPALERLRSALAGNALVRLAVLFGSRASGTARPSSDFDVGILPHDPSFALRDELALSSVLSGAVGGEVDLVRLDRDDPLLGREVSLSCICLYEAEPGAFAAYRAAAASRWIEFDETIAPHRQRLLRRLAGT